MADPFLIVTTESVAGRRTARTIGLVVGTKGQSLPRTDAPAAGWLDALKAEAQEAGANAVVGLRLDAGVAYGTAVVIEPGAS